MLIIIEESAIKSDSLDENKIASLENIFSSARLGYHIVSGERGTLKKIASMNGFSLPTLTYINKLIQKSAQNNSLHGIAKTYLSISDVEKLTKTESNGVVKLEVPLACFEDRELSNKAIIVFENITDNKFYKHIAQWHIEKNHNGISSIQINYTPENGGGDTTAKVFQEKSRDRLCACIVDNDKKYTACREGNTSRKVKTIARKLPETSKYLCLDAHEFENLIPISLYQKAHENMNPEKLEEKMRPLKIMESKNATKYFDYKKGITCKKLKSDSEYLKHWSDIINAIGKESHDFSNCIDESCPAQVIQPCSISEQCLDSIGNKLKESGYQIDLPEWLRQEWEKIGQLILDWSIAAKKQIT
jgi:hypothetical protein